MMFSHSVQKLKKQKVKINSMKAIITTKYGAPDVLQIKEVDKPKPKDDEVLIKIYATAVTASDLYIRGSAILPLKYKIPMRLFLGVTKPRKSISGLVLAGKIEAVGKKIERFKVGDAVYGLTGFGLGAYAEYKCMKEVDSTYGCLSLMPGNISYEDATMISYGGLLAFQYMERGNIQKGDKVLIYGASGTTGIIAIQYAKYLGAEVTAVCSSPNIELVKSLGADYVLDYKEDDLVKNEIHFDFMLDAVGKMKRSKLKESCKKAIKKGGKYVSIDDGDLKLVSKRLALIKELTEAGHIKAFIDRCYSFEDIVLAHIYVESGHKRGGVAITLNNN